jgi:hypothetical protein
MKCRTFAKFQVFGTFLMKKRVIFTKVRKPFNLSRHYHLPENLISCSRIGEVGTEFVPFWENELDWRGIEMVTVARGYGDWERRDWKLCAFMLANTTETRQE